MSAPTAAPATKDPLPADTVSSSPAREVFPADAAYEGLPHIVVLGGGFGGLAFCRAFGTTGARITVVDRQNHHLFQPLLYQAATAGLAMPEIAQPIRSILSDYPNITILQDEVRQIDLAARTVRTGKRALAYDYLIIGLGGVTSYFGHNDWEEHAPGLKSLADAARIRSHVLAAFEEAEVTREAGAHTRLMTMVVVGGGPTGVEMAGALVELARFVLKKDFRHINPAEARVVLIEGGDRLLTAFPRDLSDNAADTLRKMGVEVRLNTKVLSISRHCVHLEGEKIEAANIIWAAGVSANPLTKDLGVEMDRGGRLKVLPDLSLPGHPEVFAIGDLVSMMQADGSPVPGVSPAAIQMGQHAAKVIRAEIDQTPPEPGDEPGRAQFTYWDKGSMATIGRSAAVAMVGKLHMTGFLAWLAWLGVHIIFLVGFRNRIAVLLQWTYAYFTYRRGARIIYHIPGEQVDDDDDAPAAGQAVAASEPAAKK